MNMNDPFINLCYEILSKYLHFPDVADTWEDIQYGLNKKECFHKDYPSFVKARSEIMHSLDVEIRV